MASAVVTPAPARGQTPIATRAQAVRPVPSYVALQAVLPSLVSHSTFAPAFRALPNMSSTCTTGTPARCSIDVAMLARKPLPQLTHTRGSLPA